MSMETRIFELTAENEKLINENEKSKGSYKVDEELLRKEIEE